MKLTKPERDAMRKREQAATRKPWRAKWNHARRQYDVFHETISIARPTVSPDAEFIAHAREDIPRLLDDLDEAEAENERLHEMLGWISKKTTEGEIFGAIEHLRWHLANPTTEECQHG